MLFLDPASFLTPGSSWHQWSSPFLPWCVVVLAVINRYPFFTSLLHTGTHTPCRSVAARTNTGTHTLTQTLYWREFSSRTRSRLAQGRTLWPAAAATTGQVLIVGHTTQTYAHTHWGIKGRTADKRHPLCLLGSLSWSHSGAWPSGPGYSTVNTL